MRHFLAALGVLLLAACAGTGSATKTQSLSFQSKVGEAPTMSDEEIKRYLTDLTGDQLKVVCRDRQTIRSQIECTREAIFRGFDTTGEARRNCKPDAPISELLGCVVIGSLVYDLVTKVELKEPDDFNWNSTDSAFKDMARSVGRTMIGKCLEGGLATVDTCYIESVGDLFSLTDAQIASCADESDSKASADCMLRIFFVQRFEQAIKRMGTGVGQSAEIAGGAAGYQFARSTSSALRRAMASAGTDLEHIR